MFWQTENWLVVDGELWTYTTRGHWVLYDYATIVDAHGVYVINATLGRRDARNHLTNRRKR